MLVWLTLPFYDFFCGFRSVAVNSVYKLQFFYIYYYNPHPPTNACLIAFLICTIQHTCTTGTLAHVIFVTTRSERIGCSCVYQMREPTQLENVGSRIDMQTHGRG